MATFVGDCSTNPTYLKRAKPKAESADLAVRQTVTEIISRIKREGESGLRFYAQKFDGWSPEKFRVGDDQISEAARTVPKKLREDIEFLHRQVKGFAERQRKELVDFEVETLPGVRVGQKYIPVSSVGAYVPGGRYTLIASAQMSIVPARVAGVKKIIACAPPKEGKIIPEVLYSLHLAGADEIYAIGGAQAIAAMAFGTNEIEPVDMIAGPGNKYVVEAKRQVYGVVGIDFIPGPTEILIIADETQDPSVVAADLVAQAEHDVESKATLITMSRRIGEQAMAEVENQLKSLPTQETARRSWEDNGEIVLVEGGDEAVELADRYATEHIQVMTSNPRWFLDRLRNYGTAFLGDVTTTVYSDKAIGPNHILPTGRGARFTGGLWVGKYLKNVTYQSISEKGGAKVAGVAARVSRAEGMIGHALAAERRITKYRYKEQ